MNICGIFYFQDTMNVLTIREMDLKTCENWISLNIKPYSIITRCEIYNHQLLYVSLSLKMPRMTKREAKYIFFCSFYIYIYVRKQSQKIHEKILQKHTIECLTCMYCNLYYTYGIAEYKQVNFAYIYISQYFSLLVVMTSN